MEKKVKIIGAGLAGCEAAYQIAKRGIKVELYEMKPINFSPAHSNENLAEIVCSNSFKSNLKTNACGLLKEELRMLDSFLIKIADENKVPAGQALAVDRDKFSERITEEIGKIENIKLIREEVTEINLDEYTIIATGPLTSDKLYSNILSLIENNDLHFYDAAAPIIEKDSLNMNIAFYGDRYGKGDSSYINLPMNKEEYTNFYNALINASVAELHDFEKKEIFEGCMPIEVMAKRGIDTLRYGPLKPVGFTDPRSGERPYAIVQLRQDNAVGSLYNMVGFQTNLKFGEQKRVFSMIPGLENAEFVKYGVMHRNTFINSTKLLDETFCMKENEKIYFAGQITGVEGYVESIMSGLVAGINIANKLNGQTELTFSEHNMIGALCKYISTLNEKFQPMNANFGILPPLETRIKDKMERYERLSDLSLEILKNKIKKCNKKVNKKIYIIC